MKIGLVLPDIPQYSETFFNYKIKGLQESGFEITVFNGKRTKKEFFFTHINAYPIYKYNSVKQIILFSAVLLSTFLKSPSRTLKLFSLERSNGTSINEALKVIYINSHILPCKLDWLHFGFATMAIRRENVAKVIGAKMSVSFRGFDINIYPLKNPNCYNKLWNNVDKIHTISDYLQKKALKLGLSEDKAVEKITPAIETSLFKVKDDLGEIKTPLNILTVGRLSWIKNYETAIFAMKVLKDKGIDFIYNIIGTGKEFERLKFAVHQCGLDDNIFFLGQMKHSEINKKMEEADIYLQTSYEEGFCVSVLEAQAKGLLCVVSDAEGLKENVVDKITGWVVPKRNPKAFALTIEYILNLPSEKRKEIAINARRRIESEFTMEKQKVKFKNFFTE